LPARKTSLHRIQEVIIHHVRSLCDPEGHERAASHIERRAAGGHIDSGWTFPFKVLWQ
jgi:hypothetical protein